MDSIFVSVSIAHIFGMDSIFVSVSSGLCVLNPKQVNKAKINTYSLGVNILFFSSLSLTKGNAQVVVVMIDRTFNENKLTLNECLIFKHLIIDERTNFGKIDINVELYLPNKTNKM